MVDDEGATVMTASDVVTITNSPAAAPIWIIADHAGALLPAGLDLGVSVPAMRSHIACDWGVAEVADILCEIPDFAAFKARYSRLVVDLNRDRADTAALPVCSDGVEIPANRLSAEDAAIGDRVLPHAPQGRAVDVHGHGLAVATGHPMDVVGGEGERRAGFADNLDLGSTEPQVVLDHRAVRHRDRAS